MHLSEIVDAENKTTECDVLESKHPPTALLFYECLDTTASDPSLAFHFIIFDAMNGTVIQAESHSPHTYGRVFSHTHITRDACFYDKEASDMCFPTIVSTQTD